MDGRTWWKLVAAIVVGNILTGIVLWIVFMVGIASVFSGLNNPGLDAPGDVDPVVAGEGPSTTNSWERAPEVDTNVPAADDNCDPKLAAEVGLKCAK